MHKQIKAAAISFLFFAAGAAAQTAVTGTGTANTVPLFTGSSTLGNSNITQLNGNVGIGTTSPGAALDVEGGTVNIGSGSLQVPGDGGGANPSIHFTSLAPAGFNPGGNIGFWLASNGLINTNAGVSIGGNVGIGTTTPANPLNVFVGSSSSPIGAMSIDVSSFGTPANASNSYFFRVRDIGANSTHFYISGNGNVGIDTTSPGAPLEVDGDIKLTHLSGATITFQDNTVQSTAWNGTLPGGDYAESIDVQGDRTSYEPGDVIVIDPTAPGKFIKSEKAYSKLVAGVFSTKPGLVGRRATTARLDKEAEVPMAMMGIVPTKVSSENGAIEPGDLLVSANTPGYAMKGTDSARLTGAVIGKALAPLKSGSGVIEVLIQTGVPPALPGRQ